MKKILDNKGVTLLELTVSILISSIIIAMLLSLLTMALKAKAELDVNNKMSNESYFIAETIRHNIFDLGAQEVEVLPDTLGLTVIKISHTTDWILVDEDVVEQIVTDVFDILIINTTDAAIIYDGLSIDSNSIFYNGVRLNGDNILITSDSSINLLAIDPLLCGYNPVLPCEEGIIELNLSITILIGEENTLTPRTFVSTIII